MPKYRCFCTNCGWRGDSEKLTFNINALLTTKAVELADRISLSGMSARGDSFNKNKKAFKDRLLNDIKQLFISIEDIVKDTKNDKLQLPASTLNQFAEQIKANLKEIGVEENDINYYVTQLQSQLSEPISCDLRGHSANKDVYVGAMIGGNYHQIRHCPMCCAMVSSFSGVYPEISVSVLGNKRASKSTTLVATLNKFQNLGNSFAVELEPLRRIREQWSDTEELIKEYCVNNALGSTSHEAKENNQNRTNFVKGSYCIRVGQIHVLLSFIDIPGEFIDTFSDASDEETVNNFLREYEPIYRNLDFLWICVDEPVLIKKDFPDLREDGDFLKRYGYSVGEELIEPKSFERIQQALARLTNLKGIKGAALIWGKIDQLNRVNNRNTNPPPFDTFGNYQDSRNALLYVRNIPALCAHYVLQHSNHVKNQMISRRGGNGDELWNHEEAVNAISRMFGGRICYFATSNYGHLPNMPTDDPNERDSQAPVGRTIAPINTELPLLWTLSMAGALLVSINQRCGRPGIRQLGRPDDETVSRDAVRYLCSNTGR